MTKFRTHPIIEAGIAYGIASAAIGFLIGMMV